MEQKPDKAVDIPLKVQSLNAQPTDTEELINKYGTYEIQPTSDSGNVFPAIAAGLASQIPRVQDDGVDPKNKRKSHKT